jgi:chemotaxis protein MotA
VQRRWRDALPRPGRKRNSKPAHYPKGVSATTLGAVGRVQRKIAACVSDPLAPRRRAEAIRSILTKDIELTLKRHRDGQSIFRAIADTAPAMGMIGTLIGLVQMLSVLNDPKEIAPAMAIALLTTLYGAVIANLVAVPIADKLALRSAEERLTKSMVLDAVVSIQRHQHPDVLRSILQTYLPQSRRHEESRAA